MHLLVTRPEPDAGELIAWLEQAGHEVSHFPLLEIKFLADVSLPTAKPQAVLITSANGARALGRHAQMPQFADTMAITVGPASAKAAMEAGFKNIRKTGRGDVIGVIEYAQQHLTPQDGPLLYASGSKTSGDLVGELQSSGFEVDRVVLYQAIAAEKLPEKICQSLPDGVLLFSPRTAKIWLSLVKLPSGAKSGAKSGGCVCADELAKIKHYCLSDNVAKIIDNSRDRGLGKFCDIIICKEPDTPSMLQAVGASMRQKAPLNQGSKRN